MARNESEFFTALFDLKTNLLFLFLALLLNIREHHVDQTFRNLEDSRPKTPYYTWEKNPQINSFILTENLALKQKE